MELKNGTITVGEVLSHPGALALLRQYVPQIADNPLALTMAKGWSLRQVVQRTQGHLPPETVQKIWKQLERL